jgi:hypothetical protein
MATNSQASANLAGPGVMLLSAAIFGYFGWGSTWLTTGNAGQFLPFVAIFEWTLKIGSIAFLVSAVLTFALPLAGNMLYAFSSVLSAIAMAIVLSLDFLDKQHRVMPEIVLVILVVWNLYGSWSGMREVMAASAARKPARSDTFQPPG